MTALFHDVHKNDEIDVKNHRIPYTDFNEVLYADDTICIIDNEEAMNRLLDKIETQGALFGLKLNKSKCELLSFGKSIVNVEFSDGKKSTQNTRSKILRLRHQR